MIVMIGLGVVAGCPSTNASGPTQETPATLPLDSEPSVGAPRIERFETASPIDLRKTDTAGLEFTTTTDDELVRVRVLGGGSIAVTVSPGGPAGTAVRLEEFSADGVAVSGGVTQATFAEPGGEVRTSAAPDVAEHLFELSVTPPGPVKVTAHRTP